MPEVEAVARRLREQLPAGSPAIVAGQIVRPSVTRPQAPEDVLAGTIGAAIVAVRRTGKHILIDLTSNHVLEIHLRMTGNLFVIPDVRFRNAATRAWFEFANGAGLVFEDPRALGKMHLREAGYKPALGPEPEDMPFEQFVELVRKAPRTPAKLFLMDQARIAGLGNIYAAEALFAAKLSPGKPLAEASVRKLRALHQAMADVLREAKSSAYRGYTDPGHFGEGENYPAAVYDREGEPCVRNCGRRIQRIRQGGRSTYYCPACQR
ncbi:MAG: hypothetical protein JST65_04760 [Acidobacteria bacterium]|nr:hypothetical protein [Acidobacteriota bacterium]